MAIIIANHPGRRPVVSSADEGVNRSIVTKARTHPQEGHPEISSDKQKSVLTKAQSCDDIIRNRLLFKLGIYNPNFTNVHHKIRLGTTRTINIKDNTGSSRQHHQLLQLESQGTKIPDPEGDDEMSSSSWLDHESSYLIPLKLERDQITTLTPPPSSLLGLWNLQQQLNGDSHTNPLSSSSNQRPVYVHFNLSVKVIPIPSRSYDHRTRHDQLLFSCTKKKSSSSRRSHYDKVPMRSGIGLLLEEAGMNNI
jgi:hypothetical protein